MRFEALHQRIKRYSKNSGFKNPGLTFSEKFQTRQGHLLTSESQNPYLQMSISLDWSKRKDRILSVYFYGTKIQPRKGIIVVLKEDNGMTFGEVEAIFAHGDVTMLKLNVFRNTNFDNEYLYYIVEPTGQQLETPLNTIEKKIGMLYIKGEVRFIVFDSFL